MSNRKMASTFNDRPVLSFAVITTTSFEQIRISYEKLQTTEKSYNTKWLNKAAPLQQINVC